VQIPFQRVVTGDCVRLAAFLAQARPQAPLLHVEVLNPQRENGAHSISPMSR